MIIEKRVENLSIENFLNADKVELYEEITNEYPEMNKEERDRLVYDIRKNGVISPLLAIKRDNKLLIIDGRNRYKALCDISIEANDIDDKDSDEEVEEKKTIKNTISNIPIEIIKDNDIASLKIIADGLNLSRRHLSSTQKSIIAFSERFQEQREYFKKLAEINKRGGKKADAKAVNVIELAKATGTNKSYVQKWQNVEDFFSKIEKDEKGKEYKVYRDEQKFESLRKHAYNNQKKYQVISSIFNFPKNSENIEDQDTRNKIMNVIDSVIKIYDAAEDIPSIDVNTLKKTQGLTVKSTAETTSTRGKLHNPKAGEMGVYLNFRAEKDQMERLALFMRQAFQETGLAELTKDFQLWFLNDEEKKVEVSDKIKNLAGEKLEVINSKDFEGEELPDE